MKASALEKVVRAGMKDLEEVIDPFPWAKKEAYGAWLAQTFYFVSHSTRLLALCAARFEMKHSVLHSRFIDHLREERGHEFMAMKDLKNLGEKIENYPEFAETQAFYQTQYYWIEHVSPMAFFGYILCLEAASVNAGPRMYDQVKKNYGDKPSVFLKVHVQEDVDHLDKAFKQLEFLTDEERQIVADNFELSKSLYRQMYLRMTEFVNQKNILKAA